MSRLAIGLRGLLLFGIDGHFSLCAAEAIALMHMALREQFPYNHVLSMTVILLMFDNMEGLARC